MLDMFQYPINKVDPDPEYSPPGARGGYGGTG